MRALVEETSRPDSAQVVVPILLDVIRPASVLDVGCGVGTWLNMFAREGVVDLHGVDAMPTSVTKLRADLYEEADLTMGYRSPRRFDLVLCLEVGEHLPQSSAGLLVEGLVRAAPVVAFSAAIPGQGGVGHINEQWPAFWRHRFENAGYRQHDVLRPRIWCDERVAAWYRQNLFLYTEPTWRPPAPQSAPEAVVHPAIFEDAVYRSVLVNRRMGELAYAIAARSYRCLKARLAR